MMREEKHIKMQSQATACLTSFIRGLIELEEDKDGPTNTANKKLISPYAPDLVSAISTLLEKSIT